MAHREFLADRPRGACRSDGVPLATGHRSNVGGRGPSVWGHRKNAPRGRRRHIALGRRHGCADRAWSDGLTRTAPGRGCSGRPLHPRCLLYRRSATVSDERTTCHAQRARACSRCPINRLPDPVDRSRASISRLRLPCALHSSRNCWTIASGTSLSREAIARRTHSRHSPTSKWRRRAACLCDDVAVARGSFGTLGWQHGPRDTEGMGEALRSDAVIDSWPDCSVDELLEAVDAALEPLLPDLEERLVRLITQHGLAT
jgi:hypothetical protein